MLRYFIETDIKLSSAVSFAQYLVPIGNTHRLITVIGERHNNEFGCGDDVPTQTIAEYTIDTLVSNPTSQVLLEIDPTFIAEPRKWPKSVPIKEILTFVKKKPMLGSRLGSRVVGYDWRNTWIGADPREYLYHNEHKLIQLTSSEILDMYVNPFYKHERLLKVCDEYYDSSAYNLLTRTFIVDLKRNIEYITENIRNEWELHTPSEVTVSGVGKHKGPGTLVDFSKHNAKVRTNTGKIVTVKLDRLLVGKKKLTIIDIRLSVINKLRHFWKKVTDWNILRSILKISSVTEAIAIMGEEHAKNLRAVLGNTLVTSQTGSNKDCVSLFKSMHLK